jgi:hypothetical protein
MQSFFVSKCFSEGQVKNFGVPKELLQDETSVLYDLTKRLPPNEKKLIYENATNPSTKQKLTTNKTLSQNKFVYENKALAPIDTE